MSLVLFPLPSLYPSCERSFYVMVHIGKSPRYLPQRPGQLRTLLVPAQPPSATGKKPKTGMPTGDNNHNTTNPKSFSQDGNEVTLSIRVDGLSTHTLD